MAEFAGLINMIRKLSGPRVGSDEELVPDYLYEPAPNIPVPERYVGPRMREYLAELEKPAPQYEAPPELSRGRKAIAIGLGALANLSPGGAENVQQNVYDRPKAEAVSAYERARKDRDVGLVGRKTAADFELEQDKLSENAALRRSVESMREEGRMARAHLLDEARAAKADADRARAEVLRNPAEWGKTPTSRVIGHDNKQYEVWTHRTDPTRKMILPTVEARAQSPFLSALFDPANLESLAEAAAKNELNALQGIPGAAKGKVYQKAKALPGTPVLVDDTDRKQLASLTEADSIINELSDLSKQYREAQRAGDKVRAAVILRGFRTGVSARMSRALGDVANIAVAEREMVMSLMPSILTALDEPTATMQIAALKSIMQKGRSSVMDKYKIIDKSGQPAGTAGTAQPEKSAVDKLLEGLNKFRGK